MMFSDSLVLVKEKWAIIFKLWSRSIDSPPRNLPRYTYLWFVLSYWDLSKSHLLIVRARPKARTKKNVRHHIFRQELLTHQYALMVIVKREKVMWTPQIELLFSGLFGSKSNKRNKIGHSILQNNILSNERRIKINSKAKRAYVSVLFVRWHQIWW